MTESTSDITSEAGKKDLFLRLVETQDGGTSVVDSRQRMATEYGISVDQVVTIEREGISNAWPPLS